MTKVEANRIHEIQKQIFWVLAVVIAALGILYVYLTAISIVDVATRKRIEREVVEMRGEAVTMELAYLEKQNSITPDLALSMGFVVPNTEFASRSYNVAAVSLRNEN